MIYAKKIRWHGFMKTLGRLWILHGGFSNGPIPYHVCSYWGINNYPKMKHYIAVLFRVEGFILYVKKMQYLGGFINQRIEKKARKT